MFAHNCGGEVKGKRLYPLSERFVGGGGSGFALFPCMPNLEKSLNLP